IGQRRGTEAIALAARLDLLPFEQAVYQSFQTLCFAADGNIVFGCGLRRTESAISDTLHQQSYAGDWALELMAYCRNEVVLYATEFNFSTDRAGSHCQTGCHHDQK